MSNTITQTTNPENIALAIEKINKLNAKASKKGFDNVINYTVSDIELVPVKNNGIILYNEVQTITIERRQPLINGWRFVGKIDYTLGADKGIINGDNNIPSKYRESCYCEHCNINRYRNTTYVLQNELGDYINVGSTCLQDFLSVQVDTYVSAYFTDIDCDNISGSSVHLYNVVQLIAIGQLIAENYGYVSGKMAAEKDVPSTADLVLVYLGFTELYKSLGPINQTHIDFANKVIEYFINKDVADNAYLHNLKTILSAPAVRVSHINMVVSAIGTYKRDIELASNKVEYTKGFLGSIKDKVVIDVMVESIRPMESYYGINYLIKMRTNSNHCVVWFASNKPDFEENNHIKIKGTIKEHKVYRDIDQTYITRAKQVV